jgi:hypothetical protein
MRELLGGKGTISLLDCSAKNAPNTDLHGRSINWMLLSTKSTSVKN